MSDAYPLPRRPKLEDYQRLARDLQSACRQHDDGEVRAWAERWRARLARHRESGGLESAQKEARRTEHRWREFRKADGATSPCSLAFTRRFIAREHGFESWPKFARHVQALNHPASPISIYEAAVEAIIHGKAAKLRKLLREHPALARARSMREHRSTLLHYVSANGVEDFRQVTPPNIVEITRILLQADAVVDAESEAYGGGSTTLGLVATSVHPERAGVQIELLKLLLAHGAQVEARGAAGNGHSAVRGCLANGQPKAAEFLANRGAAVDLEDAAGLGKLDAVRSFFDRSGAVWPGAGRLQSAFFYSCWYGHASVVEFLLSKGADPAARDRTGKTGLHCAAYGAHVELVKLLVDRGSPVDARESDHRATPLDVALWTWNNSADRKRRKRCYDVIRCLVRGGAELDPKHWQDPEAPEQSPMLARIGKDKRMRAALRGQ